MQVLSKIAPNITMVKKMPFWQVFI